MNSFTEITEIGVDQQAVSIIGASGNLVDGLMTIKEACEFLKISESTYYDWRNEKSPRFQRSLPEPIVIAPKTIRIDRKALIDWTLSKRRTAK